MIDSRLKSNLKEEFKQSRTAQIGVIIFIILLIVAVFAPFIATHDPVEQNADNKLVPPVGISVTETETVTDYSGGEVTMTEEEVTRSGSMDHLLGTNALGQDIFSRLVYGTRTSMLVGLLGTGISALIGVSIGLISGYFRGTLDDVLMRFADVMLALPALIFAIVMIGLFGSQSISIPDPFVYFGLVSNRPAGFSLPTTLILVIAIVNWVTFARVARGEAISVATQEHVKSAKAIGAGHWEILKSHIFPNSVTPVLVYATINIAFVIIIESGLSFLGFTSTTLSWGFNIAQGRAYLSTSWWIAAAPGIAIMAAVFSVNLMGDWLRDSLDPGMQETRNT